MNERARPKTGPSRQYLLGALAEEERARIEADALRDDGRFEELLALEDELFHEYAQGGLSDVERAQFETRFLSTPGGDPAPRGGARAAAAARSGPRRGPLPARHARWLAAAAALLIAARTAWLGWRASPERIREAARPQATPSPIPTAAPSAAPVRVIALALSPGLVRGAGADSPGHAARGPGDALLRLDPDAAGGPPRRVRFSAVLAVGRTGLDRVVRRGQAVTSGRQARGHRRGARAGRCRRRDYERAARPDRPGLGRSRGLPLPGASRVGGLGTDTTRAPGRVAYVNPALYAAFFVSGAAALLFEVVWTRLLLIQFGATSLAVAVVLGAFMGGMAVGSALAPRLLLGRRDPVRTYALLEIGVGLYGLATPALIGLVAGGPPAVRFAACLLVLLAATAAMGASLPVLAGAILGRVPPAPCWAASTRSTPRARPPARCWPCSCSSPAWDWRAPSSSRRWPTWWSGGALLVWRSVRPRRAGRRHAAPRDASAPAAPRALLVAVACVGRDGDGLRGGLVTHAVARVRLVGLRGVDHPLDVPARPGRGIGASPPPCSGGGPRCSPRAPAARCWPARRPPRSRACWSPRACRRGSSASTARCPAPAARPSRPRPRWPWRS